MLHVYNTTHYLNCHLKVENASLFFSCPLQKENPAHDFDEQQHAAEDQRLCGWTLARINSTAAPADDLHKQQVKLHRCVSSPAEGQLYIWLCVLEDD